MWIENVSAEAVAYGKHRHPGERSMLIQIGDPDHPYLPDPALSFTERHQFTFKDLPDDSPKAETHGISNAQALEIVSLLQRAIAQRMNVVVHCVSGYSRSGAVVEAGLAMGFEQSHPIRSPSARVKRLLMRLIEPTLVRPAADAGVR